MKHQRPQARVSPSGLRLGSFLCVLVKAHLWLVFPQTRPLLWGSPSEHLLSLRGLISFLPAGLSILLIPRGEEGALEAGMSQETSQQHNPPAVGISALLRFFRGCALDKTLRFSELVTEVLGQKLWTRPRACFLLDDGSGLDSGQRHSPKAQLEVASERRLSSASGGSQN